jgi:hypothetical protein
MRKSTKGVGPDTRKAAEIIANDDAADNSVSQYLYRTKEGKYFLQTEKMQIHKGGKWIDYPMDGSARGVPKEAFRHDETETPMTENEAVDWYLATVAPEPLAKAIRKQIGTLVSVELGDLAEPLARFCRDKGVSAAENAIVYLQSVVAKRFGCDFGTDAGAGTIYISHDGVSLTNPQSSIVAQRAGSIARQLTARAHASCRTE